MPSPQSATTTGSSDGGLGWGDAGWGNLCLGSWGGSVCFGLVWLGLVLFVLLVWVERVGFAASLGFLFGEFLRLCEWGALCYYIRSIEFARYQVWDVISMKC